MSLTYRISFALAVLTSLMTLSIVLFVNDRVRDSLEENNLQWSKVVTLSLAEATASHVLAQKSPQVREILRQTASSNPGIAYIIITDFQGKIFAHTFDEPAPESLITKGKRVFDESGISIRKIYFHDIPVNELTQPLIEGLDAHIQLGVNLTNLKTITTATTTGIILVGVLIMILGAIFSILITRRITLPIRSLAGAMSDYASGNQTKLPKFTNLDSDTRKLLDNFEEMIRQKEQSDDAVWESEEKYRGLAESLPQIVFELDQQGYLTYLNRQGAMATGYTSVDIENGLKASQLIIPEERDRLSTSMSRILNEQIDSNNEYTVLRKDGTFFPGITYSRPVIQNDEAKGIRGIIVDITERKKAEETLAKNRAEFEAIFNSITDAIVFADTERRIQMINPAFTYIFGYDFEEVKGRTTEFFYADPNSYKEKGKERYHVNGDFDQPIYENDYRRKNGSIFTAETLGVPVQNSDGRVVGFLGIMRDITERKKVENEKVALEGQLRQSYKMEAIGTMAGGIAHDFNNILSVIINASEMTLEDIPEGNETKYYTEMVLKAGHRAKDLVKQILAFSRKSEQELVPIRPHLLIKEDMKLVRSTIPSTISIMERIDSSTGLINADPSQIHQLIMNLCNNAAHAMDEKGALEVKLNEVELLPEDFSHKPDMSSGRYCHISVSDTGCGMEKELVDRIFDPFFTTKEVNEGTGMGLSVVHGIVEGHNGMRMHFPLLWPRGTDVG